MQTNLPFSWSLNAVTIYILIKREKCWKSSGSVWMAKDSGIKNVCVRVCVQVCQPWKFRTNFWGSVCSHTLAECPWPSAPPTQSDRNGAGSQSNRLSWVSRMRSVWQPPEGSTKGSSWSPASFRLERTRTARRRKRRVWRARCGRAPRRVTWLWSAAGCTLVPPHSPL